MGAKFGSGDVTDRFLEMYVVARQWWLDDVTRLLPSEGDGNWKQCTK